MAPKENPKIIEEGEDALLLENTQMILPYRKRNLKYTTDEYDHFQCFLAAESAFDIRFSPSRLCLAV